MLICKQLHALDAFRSHDELKSGQRVDRRVIRVVILMHQAAV